MVKVKVIQRGVYLVAAGKVEEQEQAIGTVLQFEKVPAFLLNKVSVVGSDEGKTLVTAGPSEKEIQDRIAVEAKRLADVQFKALLEAEQKASDAEKAAEESKNGKK